MRQCICQICVCGRHRCEHSSRRKIPFAKDEDVDTPITEHKERFRHFGFQPRQKPIKPQGVGQWKGDAPPVKESTTKKDFVAFPIRKRTLKRPKGHKETLGKMADSTTYKHDFIPKKPIPTIKAEVPKPCGDGMMPGTLRGKMEVSTTYNRSYTPKSGQKRDKAVTKTCTLTELGKPFAGQTETGLSYKPPPIQTREEYIPNKGTLKPEGEFQGSTTHKTDFTPKYQVPERAIKKFPKWTPGKGKFEDETTHRHDFKCPVPAEKTVACTPKPEMPHSGGPFEGKSHYKQDFKPHEISGRKLPKWHPLSRPFKKPTTPFADETTYHTDYEAPPEDFPQYGSFKPQKGNLTIPSGPMEKNTTSMRDYQKIRNPVPTQSFKPEVKYEKPKDKFDGHTITNTDYTPKPMEKTTKAKLGDSLRVGDGPMDDMTMTMKDFQWLALECPAAYIKLFGKDALPQFEFDKTEKGHMFFKKLKKTKCHKTGLTKKAVAVN